jgi:flagellin
MANIDVTRIAGNIGALNALNSLESIDNELSIHQTRLATGKRLSSASDDPAGMQMATTFDVRRQSMETALGSIGDAKNLLATAEGGLSKIQDILVQMRGKVMQAAGDTMGTSERAAIKVQLDQYAQEIDDIVSQTTWNGNSLIGQSGSAGGQANAVAGAGGQAANSGQFTFMTGADGESTTLDFIQGFGAYGTGVGAAAGNTGLGLYSTGTQGNGVGQTPTGNFTLDTAGEAATAQTTIDAAIQKVADGITNLGVYQARLGFKEDTLNVSYTNTQAAYNRIMNADMASEQVDATKYTILQQSATAMLAQANAAPQFLLKLFQ